MVSYARPGRSRPTRNEPVEKFLQDLNYELSQFSNYAKKHPGEFDLNFDLGENWKQSLADLVSTCHVLIPLISRPFLDSEWCGKEWSAFSRREVTIGPELSPGTSAILPIIWVPVPDGVMHPVVGMLQYNTLAMPNSYATEGLLALSRRANSDYDTAVHFIARRVDELLRYATVAAGEPVNMDTVASAFQTGKPTWDGVQFWHEDNGGPEGDGAPVRR